MGAGAESSGANQNTTWAIELSAQKLRGKRTTDPHERVGIDNVNGRFYLGDGAAAPTMSLGAFGQSLGIDGASVAFISDNTHDFGTNLRRPRYVRAGTGVQTGAFPRSARPSPAVAGVGTCIFDTTLGKPIWSNGKIWADATGKAV